MKYANTYEAIAADKCLSTLKSLIDLAGLADAVKGLSNSTTFAPTNAAFRKVPQSVLDTLTNPDNIELLQNVLLYHITGKAIPNRCSFVNGETLTMLNSIPTTVEKRCGHIRIVDAVGGKSKIVCRDSKADVNNFIYKINAVLIPAVL